MELNLLKCLYKLNLFSQGLLRYVKKDNIMLNNAQDWTKHCLQVLDICAKEACMVWCCALLHTYDSHSHEWQCKIAAFDTILLCMPLLVFFLLLYYSFILFHIFILCPEITTIKLNRIKYPCHFFFWTQPLISDKCVQMPLTFPWCAKTPLFELAGLCMPLAKVHPIPCTHKYPVGRKRGRAVPRSLTALTQIWSVCGLHPAYLWPGVAP